MHPTMREKVPHAKATILHRATMASCTVPIRPIGAPDLQESAEAPMLLLGIRTKRVVSHKMRQELPRTLGAIQRLLPHILPKTAMSSIGYSQ
jgi:hypothetical protein